MKHAAEVISTKSHSLTKKANTPNFLSNRVNQYYEERVNNTWEGGHIMRGRTPDKNAIHLSSNDYLAINSHPDILEAQKSSFLKNDNNLIMSAIFLHGVNPQSTLENEMATFLNSESSIICQSGYVANTGLIQSIANCDTPVYIDQLAHMSLWEGVNSAGATAHPFPHNNVEKLKSKIRKHGPGIVIVDSIYSTIGTVSPLTEVALAAEEGGCVLVVDESHSLGTHGPNGKGLVAELGLDHLVHFKTASLAKAFAARSGVISCSHEFADYFRFTSLPAIFSSALLSHEIAGLLKTIEVIKKSDDRRARLKANSEFLRIGLETMGYNLQDSKSQIIALEAGPEQETIKLRDALEKRGIFGSVFCAPATAKNRSLMRLSINSSLNFEQLNKILTVCYEIREEVGMDAWPSTRRKNRFNHRIAA